MIGVLAIASVVALVACFSIMTLTFRWAGSAGIVGFFIPALMIGPSLMLVMRFAPRLAWKRWAAEVAALGHCPSCAYGLFDLPVDADGCVVCPECGGAWRWSNSHATYGKP
jgi:hypothetical protein